MIDNDGFRPNVGIIVLKADPAQPPQVLLAKRIGQPSWQFPQGGIKRGEAPLDACYRELAEELGLAPEHVKVLGVTDGWLSYYLPKHLLRKGRKPTCIGQKQKWFLLQLQAAESHVRLDTAPLPEFDGWRWTDYWQPLEEVVFFKREVYLAALKQLAPLAGAVQPVPVLPP